MGLRGAVGKVRSVASGLRAPGFGRTALRTAGFDAFATGLAAFISMLVAALLGATGRGEYAAIMAWFGIVLVFGEIGQTAATCYFTAREPDRGRDWIATSRAVLLVTGAATVAVGLVLAPVLGRGQDELVWAYRVAFTVCALNYLALCYLGGLQAAAISRWNVARAAQSLFYLVTIGILIIGNAVTVLNTMVAFGVAVGAYTALTIALAARAHLTGGRASRELLRPLTTYGAGQLASLAPLALNSRLDQVVLSQTVPAADLGRYAVAVGLTILAVPFAGAVGQVAFPRLAARTPIPGGTARFQRRALLVSAVVAAGVLLPLCVAAPWIVPFLLGDDYRGAAELIWILAPGGVLLACGNVAGNLLRGRNRPRSVAVAYVAGIAVMVALMGGLLPALGVVAAAIASSAGYLVSFALMLRTLQRLPDDVGPLEATDS